MLCSENRVCQLPPSLSFLTASWTFSDRSTLPILNLHVTIKDSNITPIDSLEFHYKHFISTLCRHIPRLVTWGLILVVHSQARHFSPLFELAKQVDRIEGISSLSILKANNESTLRVENRLTIRIFHDTDIATGYSYHTSCSQILASATKLYWISSDAT